MLYKKQYSEAESGFKVKVGGRRSASVAVLILHKETQSKVTETNENFLSSTIIHIPAAFALSIWTEQAKQGLFKLNTSIYRTVLVLLHGMVLMEEFSQKHIAAEGIQFFLWVHQYYGWFVKMWPVIVRQCLGPSASSALKGYVLSMNAG